MTSELFGLYFNFAFFLIIFSVVYFMLAKPFAKRTDDRKEMDAVSSYLLCIGFVLVVFSFYAPYLVLHYLKAGISGENAEEQAIQRIYQISGPIGDTMGGIMNPFIAMAGVIVTGLAFYMQYKANKAVLEANDALRVQNIEQKEQYRFDKFESQFYEMLRLHKENVNEIELSIKDPIFSFKIKTDKLGEGFKTTEFSHFGEQKEVRGRKVFEFYIQEFHSLLSFISCSEKRKINQDSFSEAYSYLFHGLPMISDTDLHSLDSVYPSYREVVGRFLEKNPEDQMMDQKYLKSYFQLYKGHADYLAHYYRHLYMLVKFVIDSYEISKILKDRVECLRYLKIIRGQLSNAEQIMLFYNWIAGGEEGYGADWENIDLEYGSHKFFTKYYMLKNLAFDSLYDIYFVKARVGYLFKKALEEDRIFELDVKGYLGLSKHLVNGK